MLDFSSRKKKYYDLKLHDGTKLSLPTPTMKVFDSMFEIYKNSDSVDIDTMRQLLLEILSSNKQGIKITDEQIQAFDVEDLYELLMSYVKFVQGVLADPN